MGLDMYLYAKPKGTDPDRYLTDEEIDLIPEEERNYTTNPNWYKKPDSIDLGYWRKANQIHLWFVEHVQKGRDDCEPSPPVHPEQLADLYDRCRRVLEDPSLGPKLLPTTSGFFFGSTDYDEYYLQDLKDTMEILSKVFTDPRMSEYDIYYCSSW